ncbi:hypothetical protein WJX74_004010 [Apatococcus lobatus]|uniref:Uncharacterized protein n=1 Tax=Apatococcus lobatus TaxID=904363 RepID=A0AAW1QJ47_9CHLO
MSTAAAAVFMEGKRLLYKCRACVGFADRFLKEQEEQLRASEAYRQQIEESRAECASAAAAATRLHYENSHLRARVKDDKAHIGQLEEKMATVHESHAGLRQAFGTISLQVQRLQDYRTALKNVFESSFSSIESKIMQIDELQKSKAELEQSLLQKIHELQDQLQAEMQAKAAVEVQHAQTQDHLTSSKASIKELDQKLQILMDEKLALQKQEQAVKEELLEKQKSILQLADEVKHAFQKHAGDDETIQTQAAAADILKSELQHAEERHHKLTQKLQEFTSHIQVQMEAVQITRDELADTQQQLEQACQAKELTEEKAAAQKAADELQVELSKNVAMRDEAAAHAQDAKKHMQKLSERTAQELQKIQADSKAERDALSLKMMLDIKELQAEKATLIADCQKEADKYFQLQTSSENEREKLLCQRSADVAKLHEEIQLETDARVAETTKQRQRILDLELALEAAKVEVVEQQKKVITTKEEGIADRTQLLKDESLARDLVCADLAAKAEQLTLCQTHLSEHQAKLSAAGDENDRLKADLQESADANGILREKCAEQTEQYAALQVELAEKSQLLAQISAAAGRLPVRISPPRPAHEHSHEASADINHTPPEPAPLPAKKKKTPPKFVSPSHLLRAKSTKQPNYQEDTEDGETKYGRAIHHSSQNRRIKANQRTNQAGRPAPLKRKAAMPAASGRRGKSIFSTMSAATASDVDSDEVSEGVSNRRRAAVHGSKAFKHGAGRTHAQPSVAHSLFGSAAVIYDPYSIQHSD